MEEAHPYHQFVRKYGIPNVKFKGCTRELKLRPIDSFMRELGLRAGDYYTAIGIRADERRRVSQTDDARRRRIVYPLIDFESTDKEDVLEFWARIPWDLKIEEYQGNCLTCYKKSAKKLALVAQSDPVGFEFTAGMEDRYPRVGPEFKKDPTARDRTFFRGNQSTRGLLKVLQDSAQVAEEMAQHNPGVCSESCEMFDMEEI